MRAVGSSSPVFRESAYLGAPLVGAGIGYLFKPAKVWITFGVVLGLVIAVVAIGYGIRRLDIQVIEHMF
jgi:hypothetical protein